MKNIEFIGNGDVQNQKYFEELVERIKIIRTSEMRTYTKVRELFKTCSDDYEMQKNETRSFYSKIQNKIHYAHTEKVAAELIFYRADSNTQFMGLTSWKSSPEGEPNSKDIRIAKNYLTNDEIVQIRAFVDGLLGIVETITINNNSKGMLMNDWDIVIEEYIKLANLKTFPGYNSQITREMADKKALEEYKKYKAIKKNT